MNKIYKALIATALAGVFVGFLHPVKADALFIKDLYFGIQGDPDVTQLQEFLTSQGVYSGPISGNFFSLTLTGVKQFQNAQGISPAAGYFGPLTRTKANAILSQQIQASNSQALAETSSTPPVPTPPATTNDVNNSLQAQLSALMQQIALLQQQLTAQQQTNQTLQQIQQNTNRSSTANPTPPPPIYIYITPPPAPTPSPSPQPTTPPVYSPPPPSSTPQPGVLTVTQNNAVGSQVVVKNSTHVKIGSYSFTASSASGVQVSTVTIIAGSSAGTSLQNLGLWVNGMQFGTTQGVVSNNGQYLLSGAPFTIAAGATQVIDVYADILTGAFDMSPATTLSGCSAIGVSTSNSISCSSVTGQSIVISRPPAISISAASSNPASSQMTMGSTGNSIAAFRFTETSNIENVKITDLTVIDSVSSGGKAAFSNLSIYNGSSLLGTAGTSVALGSNMYSYSFHFATPLVVPQANSFSVMLKGDVASYASSGATDNSTHVFSIPNGADVTALGQSSNASAAATISSANGNPQTVLRSILTVTGQALGTSSGRVKNTSDNLAQLTFSANSAGSVALNNLTLTFTGSAVGATSSPGFSLVDANNVNVVTSQGATVASSPAAGNTTVTWTFGVNGFQISAGTSYTFTVRYNSIAYAPVAASNSSVSLGVVIQNAGDVQYSDALDSAAISGLTLPTNVIPLNVTSVTFASGT